METVPKIMSANTDGAYLVISDGPTPVPEVDSQIIKTLMRHADLRNLLRDKQRPIRHALKSACAILQYTPRFFN